MRILTLHATYFTGHWRREHDVRTWGLDPYCDLRPTTPVVALGDILRALPAGWTPDLIFLGDDHRLLRVTGLDDAPCPTAMLSLDPVHAAGWQAPLASACDTVFVAQRDCLSVYEQAGASGARWLPLWAPDDLPPPEAGKSYGVAFVGALDRETHRERVALLGALRARLPLYAVAGPYADVFARAMIVLNDGARGELNGRVFEALGCGAFLLTPRTGNGLLDLFADGQELVTYPRGDVEALVATAARYLNDERVRTAIGERGRARVQAGHCERHRAAEVLAHAARPAAPRPSTVRSAGAARAYCQLAHEAGRLVGVFPGEPLYPRLRAAYLDAAAALAAGPRLAEPDRRAVAGLVALTSGRTDEAVAHLALAAEQGGQLEDRLGRIEAFVCAGDLRRARAEAETLCAAHPDYELGPALVASLGALAAPEGPEEARP